MIVLWDDPVTEPQDQVAAVDINASQQKEPARKITETGKPNSMESKIDKMLELYLTLNEKIDQGNRQSQERITNLRNAHNNLAKRFLNQKADLVERDIRINTLENDLMQAKADLSYMKTDLAMTRKELSQTRLAVVDLVTTTGMLNSRVEDGEKARLDQWSEIKEKKLILSGLAESKGEKVRSVVLSSLKEVLKKCKENQQTVGYKGPKFTSDPDNFSMTNIDSVYRIGKFRKGSPPRNIMVSFVKSEDRKLILKAKNAVNMSKDFKFYINEDMSVDTRSHRATIKRLSKAAKDAGLKSTTSGDKLIVDETAYTSNELDILPGKVLRCCSQEKWVNGGLAFRGERSVFSNFYTKAFVLEGHRFISMEQYFQYSKAEYFEDSTLARKLLVTSSPSRLQTLGERLYTNSNEYEEWVEFSREVLHKGIYAKFSQNPSLKKDLLSTGDYQLYEATTDLDYGCGVNLISKAWDDQSWTGQNLTGRALVEVRDRLRLEQNEDEEIQGDVNTTVGSQVSSDEHDEYRISRRKSKAHFHSSANCYSMIRSIKPFRRLQRPRPPTENFVTGRSQARDSNMHESEKEDDGSTSTASTDNDMEVGTQSGTDANPDPDV